MLFWIFVCLMIIGAVIWWIKRDDRYNDLRNAAKTLFWFAFIAVMISLVIIFCMHTDIDGQIEKNNVIYDSLTYQYTNDIYDMEYYKRDLIDRIEEWNKDLAYYQKVQDNFWIGIYIPDIFDQFEFIELERVMAE